MRPEYFPESRAALNQSHVFVHRQNVADAVAKVREGLSSEGMGDLGELVRAADASTSGRKAVMMEVERRAAFRRRIFLPRILARDGDDWRLFDYENDLFPHVDWEALEWTKAAEFSPNEASSLTHTSVAVDVDQLGPDPKKPLGVAEAGDKPDLDFPALTRLLVDVIPNPWQAARILRGALAALRARGFTEDQLLASRYRLIEKMRADLLAAIYLQTERIFCNLLAEGGLSFRLEGKGLNWELLEETKGKPSNLVVVETKGLHLKNEDTDYKRKLFETLERFSEGGVPVGELVLGDAPGPMRFRLIMEGNWKSQVDAALLAEDA